MNMNTVDVTSNTSMNVPDRFTMSELMAANTDSKYPTLNARVDKLMSLGDVTESIVDGKVETIAATGGGGRGRGNVVYLYKKVSVDAPKKERKGITVKVTKIQPVETVDVPVEVIDSVEKVSTLKQ